MVSIHIAPPTSSKPTTEMDRWILSRLHALVGEVTSTLEQFDAARTTQAVEAFIEDLSNWYVRLSRRRFWRSESDEDKQSAYSTLYEVLVTLAKLISPILPFTAEEIYRNLVCSVDQDAPESVHLCDWPRQDTSLLDEHLMRETEELMKVVRLGRAARNTAGIKVRQPLAKVFIKMSSDSDWDAAERNRRLILDELNVKTLAPFPSEGVPETAVLAEEEGVCVALETTLNEELIQEGMMRDLIRKIQNLRKESGFNVEDRIIIHYQATEKLASVIKTFAETIQQETLAEELILSQETDSLIKVKLGGEEALLGLSLV